MLYNLKNENERTQFKENCNKLYKNREVVDMTKKSNQRTLNQNSYLHLLLGYFACQYGCSLEEVKIDFFKRLCNKDLFEIANEKRDGKRLRSSKELDTKEMTTAIERFKNWSASVDILLPDAENKAFLIQAQQEVDRNKEFI